MSNDIEIIEFRSEFASQVKPFVYFVLESVGVDRNKYPIIDEETELNYMLNKYMGRSRLWLAVRDKKLVGTIALEEINATESEIKRMLILPEYQGRGLGKRLMNKALEFAKTNGYHKIVLYTDRIMSKAQRFYEKYGFKKAEETKEWFCYDLYLNHARTS